MKKIYTLAIALFGTFAFGQTPLNTNGSLEAWTDGTVQADGWFMSNSNLSDGIVTRIEGDAQDGDISVRIEAKEGTSGNNNTGLADVAVTPGETYTVTYWYKSEDDTFNFRHWIQWRTVLGGGNNIEENVGTFQPGESNASSVGQWTQVTVTETAPATAAAIRVNFRNYSSSSDVYIDNVSVYQGTASIKDNNIAGLSVYPNPVTGNTLYVTSFNSVDKSVAIFDVLGKQVINTTTVNGAVNVANLNAGVYIVKVTEEGKTATRKLVVK